MTIAVVDEVDLKSLRVFLWNEKLTHNQISESEGLCVFVIKSEYKRLHPCTRCPSYRDCNRFGERSCTSTIPFDLSMLLNRDPSLGSILMSATLQFVPGIVESIGRTISNLLFAVYKFSPAFLLPPPPRPTYVIAIEISHIREIDYSPHFLRQDIPGIPPPIPSFCRFAKDWLEEDRDEFEDLRTELRSLSPTEFMNDPYHKYMSDVLDYVHALRDYAGEGGTCPTKPPIVPHLPRGLVEVDFRYGTFSLSQRSCRKRHLMDNSCAVCFEEFKDRNEVTPTYCSHVFHTECLLLWLTRNNTCPSCRAGYPLHYSPSLNPKRQKIQA